MATHWELQRNWEIVRYLVYYLIEDLVPPHLIPGKDVVDFSCGLGDLSVYMLEHGPRSLTATAPEEGERPPLLREHPEIAFLPGLPARQIAAKLPPASADLFVARMVFQFPTEEQDRIDVDGMLAQIHGVLRPGGRLIVSSHEFIELDRHLEAWGTPLDQYFHDLLAKHSGDHRRHLEALIEMLQTLGIPPREGSHGQTGFGLKAFMAVDSFVQAGFRLEASAEIEDFTFPIGISANIEERRFYYQDLAEKVFAIKRRKILGPAFQDKYTRPGVLQDILKEINRLHPFVTVPIFALWAVKAA